jgi:AAA domain-containing protein
MRDATRVGSPDAPLLARFVAAFKRGIEREVAAMRASSETFELPVAGGEPIDAGRYALELAEASDRLAAGTECSLRTARGEQRVTIERCEDLRLTVTCEAAIDLAARPLALVIAPWFLYDRLVLALDELDADRHPVALALALFGKRVPRRAAGELRCDHAALNPSQRAAVQLCTGSELAFLWGPPGTGKTQTLTHIVEELLASGRRILLASTTNAAIDQVLAKLAAQPWFTAAVASGALVRLGRSNEDTFGAELADVVGRMQGQHRGAIDRLRARIALAEQQLQRGERLLAEAAAAAVPQQSLFAEPAPGLRPAALASVFPPGLAEAVARLPPPERSAALRLRLARLARLRGLARERIARHTAALRDLEDEVVGRARVVMCTLTNAYLSPLMKAQRFDVLIAEEAGMATLPALFLAACRCTDQAIMVGDPRQLPPIVHARDEVVQRAIGRSVFDVTIPDPARSDLVALLDIQYRMHPAIGELVGRLFYDGRLRHAADEARSHAIAARAPYPGMPVVVVDTAARTACQRSARGASRVNPASAELTAELAGVAVAGGAASVAVITPYAAQASGIQRQLAARRVAGVECATIHRFQGRECDVVILDLVDAAPMRPGLLLSGGPRSDAAQLLNVSLSRARGKLILVADVGYFADHAPGSAVTAILGEAIRTGVRIGPAAR